MGRWFKVIPETIKLPNPNAGVTAIAVQKDLIETTSLMLQYATLGYQLTNSLEGYDFPSVRVLRHRY